MTQQPYGPTSGTPVPPWQAAPPPAPPRKPRTALVISLIIGIPTFIVIVLCAFMATRPDQQGPANVGPVDPGPQATVAIDSCAVLGGSFRATFTLTSRASSDRSFRVLVEWKTPDGTRAASDEVLVSVAAGATVRRDARDTAEGDAGVQYVCAAEVLQ
jgi:hypothetical protein